MMPRMPQHPLDPLSADEIREAVAIVRRERGVGERWRFASIELREPAKAAARDFTPGEALPREAVVVCFNRDDGRVYKGRVVLHEDRVAAWGEVLDGQPNMTVDEFTECDEAMRRDPRVIEALARRGITDLDKVLIDTWAYGAHLLPEEHKDGRIGWADIWYRAQDGSSPYANPVTGLHLVVDLNRMELLEVEDTQALEEPRTMGEYAPALVPGLLLRPDIKPLEISQPDGPSFTVDGHAVAWQKWTLRVGFNHREGMVLHTVAYDGRPVAHRLSFAEMVVPYRDPTNEHYRRTAFDVGEWGLGFMTTSLELGCDCLGEIRYLDAVMHDTAGEPYTIKDAICLHEEDDAILWKHVDAQAGAQTRRARRLVVSFHVTVANYEYLVYWRLYQDGNIECEVRATGIMVTTHFAPGAQPPYGTLVDDRTYAPFHQHFLIARLDLDVDGEANTVYATESEMLPIGDGNPHGLALVQRDTPLRTEQEGIQDYDWGTQRAWKVVSDKTNGLGTRTGYKLVPGGAFPPLMHPDSPVLQRARAIEHTLWVTPFHEDERWPCGEFVVQSGQDRGLPVWTSQDRPIADTDVVLWYVFGIHHITRPEEWPVMSVDKVSFWLKPVGFFDRNPALDVPPSPVHCHTE
jgi:primary-amine oxidase